VRLVRIEVSHFGSIRQAAFDFGPGLNVLYGPNDLGKSTLAEAIRLALLLPSTSTAHEPWIPWTGAHRPIVDLVFWTADRYWRVRKEFGPGNNATLRKSVDNLNWDEVARGRQVDGEIRQLLAWGIAEPGGNAPRGVGTSFLATALLSTQSDVGAVLQASFADDSADGGKQQVAAALQALAQDPLFKSIVDAANAEYDRAFTAQGRKKGSAGGVFKVAAERVREARVARDEAAAAASDATTVAVTLRKLVDDASAVRIAAGEAAERVAALERQRAFQAARAEVERIATLAADIATLEERVRRDTETRDGLAARVGAADLEVGKAREALRLAEEPLRDGADESGLALERIRLKGLVELAASLSALEAANAAAQLAADVSARAEQDAARRDEALRRLDGLDRFVELRAAEAEIAAFATLGAQIRVLRARVEPLRLARAARPVPAAAVVPILRTLERDLAVARGKLAVGLAVSIQPHGEREIHVSADGDPAAIAHGTAEVTVDARAAVEVVLPGIATVRIAAGDANAREEARKLSERWDGEAVPVLAAAQVLTVEALADAVAAAAKLEQDALQLEAEIGRLEKEAAKVQVDRLRARADEARAAAGTTTEADLSALGSDPQAAIRTERSALERAAAAVDLGALRTRTALAAQAAADAEKRLAAARENTTGAPMAEDEARAALAALESGVAERKRTLDAALASARTAVTDRQAQLAAARTAHETALAAVATLEGRLTGLRAQLANEDTAAANERLSAARALLHDTPRPVTDEELAAAETVLRQRRQAVADVDEALHRAQGALEQVGGAVSDERLRDAEEALAIAEQSESAIEAEYDAWRMLREHLLAAEQAQASHLGQALAPGLSQQFAALTGGRYGALALTAQLGTEGIVVHGSVRDVDRLSVGTREQLSTLYRLCLAERLGSTLVLDDQLVQSDEPRLDWFRALLREKAKSFQIVVLTCRPEDYVDASADQVVSLDLAQVVRVGTA
jgi:hypothetical protein